MAVGLSVYLTLPLRALFHPPVNWGNPVTLDGFFWLVSGKLYQGLLLDLSFSQYCNEPKLWLPFCLSNLELSALALV